MPGQDLTVVVTITSQLRLPEAQERLQRLFAVAAKIYSLSGQLSGPSVTVMRSQQYGNSLLRPQFVGVLQETDSGCALTGEFGFSTAMKGFLKGWFALLALWTVAATLVTVTHGELSLWPLPVGGIVLLCLGALFVKFAKSYYASDRDVLIRTLSEELGA